MMSLPAAAKSRALAEMAMVAEGWMRSRESERKAMATLPSAVKNEQNRGSRQPSPVRPRAQSNLRFAARRRDTSHATGRVT